MTVRIPTVTTCGFCEYIAGDANQHFPHYHLHVVPRFPGSDPTRIYLQTDFTPISIAEQRELATRIRLGCERTDVILETGRTNP